jgi:Tol biopolymer transport system component
MLTVARGTRGVCIAVAVATVVGVAATSVGAAQPVNGQIAFAATVGQESRLFTVTPGQAPVQRTQQAQVSDSPSWSPNGRQVVVSSPGGYGTAPARLFVITLATGVEQALTPLQAGIQDLEPTWSPDGRLIAFTRLRSGAHAAVMVVHADGSDAVMVYAGHSPAWAPDSRQIAFVNSRFIFRIAVGGTARRLVRKLPAKGVAAFARLVTRRAANRLCGRL